uniref:ATP-dependent DNA helicase n=1 Tax=Dicentrarchus labrax TaxID=13489 RepID=A0A8C4HPS9_DICLA
MPRKGKRSQAQKVRWRKPDEDALTPTHSPAYKVPRLSESPRRREAGPSFGDFLPRRGTGTRHRVRKWPVSVTGCQHKLVIPAESPDKKFVLIVGASHLRSIADGIVPMPEGMLSFGVMSTPGACASHLRTELRNAVVPRTPDAVCIMAPSNNLTASRTPLEAGADFLKLLKSADGRWPGKVFVLDFVPRLTVDPYLQELFSQEFHRVAAGMRIKYYSSSRHFPLDNLDLWSPDGVHLSDGEGMVVLAHLLWAAAYEHLEAPVLKPQAAPRTSLPVRHFTPRVVVRGEVIVPRPSNPYEWTSVEKGRKRNLPEEPAQSSSAPKKTEVQQQECFIPLNPVRFSSSILAAMDAVVPSHLPTPEHSDTAVPQDKTKPVVERRRKAPRPTPASHLSVAAAAAEAQVTPCVVDTCPEPSPATAVEVAAAAAAAETPKAQTPPRPRSFWIIDDAPTCSRYPTTKWKHEKAILSVRATHCQNDARYNTFSRNHQCTCMALTFLAYHNEGLQINTTYLDRVLEQGDLLYVGIKNQLLLERRYVDDHLTVEEMPQQVLTDTSVYNVHMSSVRCGYLKAQEGNLGGWLTLDAQLQSLSTHVSHAILIVSPECIAVFRDTSGRYGVFDSHSRNARGLQHPDGTAVMLTFSQLSDLSNHLQRLFEGRGANASYEFVPVTFESVDKSSERHGQPGDVKITQSASAVPPSEGSVEAKSPATFCRPEEELVQVLNISPAVPQACASVEDSEKNAGKGQPNILKVVTKLSKHQRRKALRRSRSTKKAEKSTSQRHNARKEYERQKYASISDFKRNKVEAMKTKYGQDCRYRKEKKLYIVRRYQEDSDFQNRQRKYIKLRYNTDSDFQSRQRKYIKLRYNTDSDFQSRQRQYIKQRYNTDSDFQSRQRQYIKQRYNTDSDFQSRQRQYIKQRYNSDQAFRLHHIRRCTQQKKDKLTTNAAYQIHHKLQRAQRIKRKYRRIVINCRPQRVINPVMEAAISSFREKTKQGPTYVCTVCHRTLFANQVMRCKRTKYVKNSDLVAACLTGKYVHVCDIGCSSTCTMPHERMQEWICYTCDDHLRRGNLPPIAMENKLELAPIPSELAELNVLERQLIAKILPFAKIVALPKGQQRAVHGAVVCVPSEVEATVNSLPRPSSDAQLLQVKLKRRIKYKGHQYFYTVNMKNVLAALVTLKDMHSQYKDVSVDHSATFNSLPDDLPCDKEQTQQDNGDASEQADQSKNPEKDELRPGLVLDSCMQPPDIAQEVLSYGDGIFSVAPAQGNKPVGFFAIPKLEAMAFPVQFPTGQNTLDEVRGKKLSPSKYFNARLFCVDTRFASDQSYLFFAQFVTETHMATNSMSIQLRKGKPMSRDGRKISSKMLQDKQEVEKLITNQDATRFMRPLRGTPAYWEKTLKDMNAMVRQLGKPTFFLTFSAAEMRWPEVIEAVKAQQGEQVDFSQLDWNAKCDILRSNPVTVMRLFEKRVDALMTDLIRSPAQPIGEVEDYFYRVEFQARGSPHIHLLVWIKDAPEFGDQDDAEVINFIDQYITCQMPDPKADPELHKIVSEVQVHSRNHSKSCKKGNVMCRFGFPKLPMERTIITFPEQDDDDDDDDDDNQQQQSAQKNRRKGKKGKRKNRALRIRQKEAKDKLQMLRNFISDPNASFNNLSELLEKCNLTYEEYRKCVTNLTMSNVIMLKRHPNHCWVNGYNPDLLRAWNANMDIQFVLDEFSCLMYMMSYVSKPEHEMTEFLNDVIRDVKKTDVNENDEMKHIMQAYAKHREVSAQEAVARTCSLPLKKCSRNVVFIQTDDNATKMSLPMSRLKDISPDSDQVWMSGLPEKYAERPQTPEYECLCLADFASQYRTLYGQQSKGKNAVSLLNDKGHIQKRTVGKPAIIRFARFSEEKDPERFYGRLLKLYLPHRSNDDLKSKECPTYEQFYKRGRKWGYDVRALVDIMKKKYEGHGKEFEKALEKIQKEGLVVDAWNTFAPEVEVDRLECIAEREAINPINDNEMDNVPDFQVNRDSSIAVPAIEAPKLSPDFVRKLYQSLNETQACIFYTVREWCLKRVWGHNPEQFFYFVSGGAGCGKSHVIKCIHEEATKILRQLPRFRDQGDMSTPAVLLTAFTGTAAFNISGKTLHSMLKLPRSLKPPYQGLGNTLDEMRAILCNAEILIIDEISMVSKELFAYVHWRFQQIKGNKKPFGGMSVLAVGDFYQLPPLGKAKPLCVYEEGVLDVWKDNFQMVSLTQIMRQKDDLVFAELLNRLRVKRKTDALRDDDRALLTQTVIDIKDCPLDALHIFATNREVDEHNRATVAALHRDFVNIKAQDYAKDPTTGEMIQTRGFKGKKRDLPDCIQAAHGVRVMIVRNLDVEDGLVNGTFGTIANIITGQQDGQTRVTMIGLQLDNPTSGQKLRKKIQGQSDNLVYIERTEENMTKKGAVRRQFPMKLAFACTAHKVQGMTMESAVVSLKRVFESGMSYVALSRTTSLQGLHITDFDEKKIYADPEITAAMENMKQASFESTRPLLQHVKLADGTAQTITIIHHNTQGLPSHIEDLKCHHELTLADVLCITETHLSGSFVSSKFQLEGYNMFTRSRQVSYTNLSDMTAKDGGGVAVYCKSHIQAEARRYFQNVTDLEFVVVKLMAPVRAVIAAVYRPPHFCLKKFLPNMESLLDSLDMMNHQPVIVCGDFNEDLLCKGKKAIQELFQSKGYTQLITDATTENRTLLDHIYVSQPHTCVQSGVLQTYHSYHSPVYSILTLPAN